MTTKSDAECEQAIKEFVEITATDEALAHSVLFDTDFNLEEAIVRYYSEIESGPLPDSIIREVCEAEGIPLPPLGSTSTNEQSSAMETGENVEEEDIEPITDEDPSGSGAEDDEKINDNMDGTSREHDEGESSSNRPAAAIHDYFSDIFGSVPKPVAIPDEQVPESPEKKDPEDK